ncbi:hypothetical protein CYMTET_20270 [Cymbomonas tetramitiformis]|uniref:Transmembrane protein n=1 Tax=Cymbomonas tetramitiformis TaxID=36881 RepID=A0AAE0G4V1_9CHLO|nr:hypothetical protein CYMTET_20270 [Cymbomonas tetramitiformis]
MDDVASAFHTAFDDEDDAVFAALPTTRSTGEAGGAMAPLKSSLNLGRIALEPVVCDGPPLVQRDVEEAPLYPLSASDPAQFESPFEITFADKIFGTISPTAEASLHSCSIVRPLAVCDAELSVIDDADSDSDYGSDGDVDAYEPAVARCVRPVVTGNAEFSPEQLAFMERKKAEMGGASAPAPVAAAPAAAPAAARAARTPMLRLSWRGCLLWDIALRLTVFLPGFLLVFLGYTAFWTLVFNLQFLDFLISSTNLVLVSGSGYLWSLTLSGSG